MHTDIDFLSSAIKYSNFTKSHRVSIKEPNSGSNPEADRSGESFFAYLWLVNTYQNVSHLSIVSPADIFSNDICAHSAADNSESDWSPNKTGRSISLILCTKLKPCLAFVFPECKY